MICYDLVIRHPQGRVKMNDWHEASTLAAKSDGEISDLIVKGKGKMTGEADRILAETARKLVNYLRSFTKNETSPIPKIGAAR
jgi:hypothetical protein